MWIPRENFGLDLSAYIEETFSFAATQDFPGQLDRRVDEQHLVIVTITPWSEAAPGGTNRPAALLSTARRDINEVWRDVFNDRITPEFSTIGERPMWFFDQPQGSWLGRSPDTRDDMFAWADVWIPRLIESASLTFVKDFMARTSDVPKAQKNHRRKTLIPRMCDALLDGRWGAEFETEFVEPALADIERLGPDHKHSIRLSGQLERLRAWLAANPNGVTRELAG